MKLVNEFKSDITFHPGVTLAEKLEELNVTPEDFADMVGQPVEVILNLIRGQIAITEELAVSFQSVLKIPTRFWLKKQARFDQLL